MIVLDTNVLSELMRMRPEPRVVEWVDSHPASSLAITAITAVELLYGVARLPDGARKAELAAAIGELMSHEFDGRVLAFDSAAAEQYGDLVAERERRGRPISSADAQIAAICRTQAATLATRNVSDFQATGVRLVDPWAG